MQRASFAKSNDLVTSEWWGGELADVRTGGKSIWPSSPMDALQKAAALVGAFAVCYQAYTVLWTRPEVSVTVDSSQPLDVAANSAFPLKLAFTNYNTSAGARVELTAVTSTNSDVTVDKSERFLALEPGKRIETTLTGHTGRAGDARLQITSSVKAGRLRREESTQTTVDVRVWPSRPRLGSFEPSLGECGLGQCIARAQLSVGRREATGFRCRAQVVGYPDIEMLAVRTSIDGGGKPSANGVGAARLIKIEWLQGGSEAFREQVVELALVAQKPTSDWRAIIGKITGFCEGLTQ